MVAGYYSFDAWSGAELPLFQKHYDVALAKMEGQDATIVSDFDVMKELMLKYDAAEPMTLAPHLVGINPQNRDCKLMSATEMSAKGSKIVAMGASRDLCDAKRAWCSQDDPDERESFHWSSART